MATPLTLNLGALEEIAGKPMEEALELAERVLPLLVRERGFVVLHILPLVSEAHAAPHFYLAQSWSLRDDGGALNIFAWPPGSASQIHDHTCWGALCCVLGSITEERYYRLDDGLRANHARLRKLWTREWHSGDLASTLRPFDGGIHRMANRTDQVAVSVHFYGPRMGVMDGRDYDPSRAYVCDRFEGDR